MEKTDKKEIISCLSMVEPPANTQKHTHRQIIFLTLYDLKLFLKLEGNTFITRKRNKNQRK